MTEKNFLTLDKEFLDYCKLNKTPDVEKLARETFNKGFTILKYGETPSGGVNTLPLVTSPTSRIVEGKEKSNTRYVTTSRPVVQSAPQPTVEKWKEKGLIPEDEIIPNNMEQLRAKIPEKKDIYDE